MNGIRTELTLDAQSFSKITCCNKVLKAAAKMNQIRTELTLDAQSFSKISCCNKVLKD